MKKIYIGKSGIEGKGIFAAENIARDEFVVPLVGRIVHKTYPPSSRLDRREDIWIPVAIGTWVDPAEYLRYINHSCEPNTGFKTPRRLYALRNIKKGDEITVDYSTIEYVNHWHIRCRCKAKKCRGIIRAVQHLGSRKYKSYLPYIPRFLQKVYRQHHDTVL